MAGTTQIPLTTLAPGTYHFGPAALANSDSQAKLTIDRTVTGGFNALTAATQAALDVEVSLDGGTTWLQQAAVTFLGGIFAIKPSEGGGTLAANGFTVSLPPGTGRQARATVVMSGTSVAVAGSLVIS